jgi:hypothetical protein
MLGILAGLAEKGKGCDYCWRTRLALDKWVCFGPSFRGREARGGTRRSKNEQQGKLPGMEKEVSMSVGIVIERRSVDHPWADHSWRPVAVVPGVDGVEQWRELVRGEDWVRYLCASLPVTLHRKETEGYRLNLSGEQPAIFVVLSPSEDESDAHEVSASHATASPYEAQDYLDCGELIVEPVPMPPALIAWITDFVEEHHKDEPFKKRKRKNHVEDQPIFGKRLHPIEQRFYRGKKLH